MAAGKVRPDEYQQAVIECNSSAVVSAGAGSGKTTVLASRYLRLISEGRAGVSEILSLTFTRKAAAEMHERIYRLLTENSGNPSVASAVADFDRAAISTLDSFCSRIARDCCGLFGVSPAFVTDEKEADRIASEAALDFILKNRDRACLKEFIFINGFEKVWNDFFVMISRNYLTIGREHDFSGDFRMQMEAAEKILLACCKEIDLQAALLAGLDSDLAAVVKNRQVVEKLPLMEQSALQGEYDVIIKCLSELTLSKRYGSSRREEALITGEAVDVIREKSSSALALSETLRNRELIESLFGMTADFQEELFRRKRLSSVLGFQDVLSMAVEGLRRDHGLRAYYKSMYRYIMIDEFQDNNGLQKDLLYLLSEKEGAESDGIPPVEELNPDKLFFVGDEKQSIYMFRGADVSVFKQLSSELLRGGGSSLELKRNYRSEPDLIKFFNKVFSEVMSDSSSNFRAAFTPLEYRPPSIPGGSEIKFLYKPYDKDAPEDSLSPEESEAFSLAGYIESSVGRLDVSGKEGPRKAGYDDFAVLMRSGSNQRAYEWVFRAYGIPYVVHSVRSLFQEAPANDIYSVLQTALYPEDRAAFAAMLRSPFVNLPDDSLASVLADGKPAFAEGQEDLCMPEALERYLRGRTLFYEVRDMIDRVPAAEVLSFLWYRRGYRYFILKSPSLHSYLEYYDYLEQLALDFDSRGESMAVLLDFIRENLGQYRKVDDLHVLKGNEKGVKFMPIHQSKGLEFPVVILANAGNTGLNDTAGSEPAYISDLYGLSFNLVAGDGTRSNYFYTEGKNERGEKEDAELRRLLYVALTRAECHLVVSGCHGRNNRKGEKSLLNMLFTALGWDQESDPLEADCLSGWIEGIPNRTQADRKGLGGRIKGPDGIAAAEAYSGKTPAEYEKNVRIFTATGINASDRRSLVPAGGPRLPDFEPGLESLLSDEDAEAFFGTFCHCFLEESIKRREISASAAEEEIRSILQSRYPQCSEGDFSLMFEGAKAAASRFMCSDVWREALGAGILETEMAFTSASERGGERIFVKGVMDLYYELPDLAVVVDFKTDRFAAPGDYAVQLRLYREAAAAISGKPAACGLFYLRSGEFIRLD